MKMHWTCAFSGFLTSILDRSDLTRKDEKCIRLALYADFDLELGSGSIKPEKMKNVMDLRFMRASISILDWVWFNQKNMKNNFAKNLKWSEFLRRFLPSLGSRNPPKMPKCKQWLPSVHARCHTNDLSKLDACISKYDLLPQCHEW